MALQSNFSRISIELLHLFSTFPIRQKPKISIKSRRQPKQPIEKLEAEGCARVRGGRVAGVLKQIHGHRTRDRRR